MTERQLQDAILAYARILGWRCQHAWLSVNSGSGYPDLTLVRNGRLVFAEIKGPRGRVSAEQTYWLAELALCPGVEAHLWTPQEWHDGTIERILR